MSTDNPYSPLSVQEPPTVDRKPRRLIILAACLFIIGTLAFVVSLSASALMLMFVSNNPTTNPSNEALVGMGVYAGFGLCWMAASVLVWKGRSRAGLYAAIAGLALPAMASVVYGV